MAKTFGIQKKANPGRSLTQEVNGKTYYRYPVKTPFVKIDDDLNSFIKEHSLPFINKDDIFCISTKIISITNGYYVKEEDLEISWLAKFLVRFVKKWPDDWGYAVPQKIQLAMDIVGMPRFLLAVLVGGFLKLLGFKGWFYRIAGHNINAIDGFAPKEFNPTFPGYGFIVPSDPDKIADEIENEFGILTCLTDSNNVDSHVLGVSKKLKEKFDNKTLVKILSGNPQGQEDGTPIIIVKNKPLS